MHVERPEKRDGVDTYALIDEINVLLSRCVSEVESLCAKLDPVLSVPVQKVTFGVLGSPSPVVMSLNPATKFGDSTTSPLLSKLESLRESASDLVQTIGTLRSRVRI